MTWQKPLVQASACGLFGRHPFEVKLPDGPEEDTEKLGVHTCPGIDGLQRWQGGGVFRVAGPFLCDMLS